MEIIGTVHRLALLSSILDPAAIGWYVKTFQSL